MLAAASQLLPAAARFTRQIIPPVIATLIAAGLISAYNRAFSGHLQQPRMAALHHEPVETQAEVVVMSPAKPLAATEAVAVYDTIAPPPRLWEKEARQDAGKDQTIRIAEQPAPVPVRTAAPRAEPKPEPRAEQRHVAAVELPPPAVRSPAPVVATAPVVIAVPPSVVSPPTAAPAVAAMPGAQDQRQPVYQPQYAQPAYQQPQYPPPPYQQPQPPYQQPAYQQPQYPPPVIMAQPIVTVPDKPRPTEQARTEQPVPPQDVFGKIVDTLKPSNLFARAREFGDKIEAAGNDILPNVRQ